jgi:hypothetical protein
MFSFFHKRSKQGRDGAQEVHASYTCIHTHVHKHTHSLTLALTHSAEIDEFVHEKRDALVVIAAGNEGLRAPFRTVGAPATAKNALVCMRHVDI